ncbi:PREDICTED: autophagy-related protein 9A [Bactrocera latifrons]|uniref:Autophagy-related protein 9 n=4 Tax=Bactrocera latifrons TaxID=174628 RepID=A0A0K8TXN9_BACLA|nr:PREDICTED: autophagy-related protein 9A [Bactrocera latifrons]
MEMALNSDTNYQSLNEGNPFKKESEDFNIQDHDDTPGDSGIMIHMVPETNKARWNHIEDLDSFFTRMYNYHQKHGFSVIALDEIFQLCKFAFVVWLLTFTIYCINYQVLFGDSPPPSNHTKVTLRDVVIPTRQCIANFNAFTYLLFLLAILYFVVHFLRVVSLITQYMDMKKFYQTALHIDEKEIDNTTWHEVKMKIREVQSEQHMCIDKEQLTELDIYHRILRFKNYMVALMNKNLLPVKFNIPLLGEYVTLSRGLLFNIHFILFKGPGSPFQNNWQLRDDFNFRTNQVELAQRLSKLIMWVAVANLILAPVIFVWQCLYFLFSYANILRKEPGTLGMRTWSNYGRLYLRHFNELEHELDARLNRAYEYADRYLSSFSSPLMAVVARNILFISGGILVLILALGIYDEFVFQVEHVLTIITILSVIGLICRTMIPDENLIWCPEQLMTAILAHVHYLPSNWKNRAHTVAVRKEFENLFQFKAGYLLNEIVSPLVTPFILMFVFRPKSLELVKFFRSFTVSVKGVGNVCSFAQLDVRKHGNPDWQLPTPNTKQKGNVEDSTTKSVMDNGKTELSLIRFTLTNPEWKAPPDAVNFLNDIREHAAEELRNALIKDTDNKTSPITESLISFGTIDAEYSSLATSVFNAHNVQRAELLTSSIKQSINQNKYYDRKYHPTPNIPQTSGFEQMLQQSFGEQEGNMLRIQTSCDNSLENMRKLRISKVEGRLQGPSEALLYNLYGIDSKISNPIDITVADMSLSTLYLHNLHKYNTDRSIQNTVEEGQEAEPTTSKRTIIISKAAEDTPLLGNVRS